MNINLEQIKQLKQINLKQLKQINLKQLKQINLKQLKQINLKQIKSKISAAQSGKFLENVPCLCSEALNKLSGLKAKKKTTVALDIGNYYVKVIELSSNPEGVILSKVSVAELPDSASSDDTGLSDLVRRIVNEKGIPSKTVNISVSDPGVIVRYVFMPLMNKDELDGAVNYEAEKYIPFNMNEVILGYQVLERRKQEHRMRVLLVAVKKELIERRLRIVRDAGLEVGLVDVDAFAIINSFLCSNPEIPGDVPTALLNIGHKSTSISIIKDGMPFFTREIPVAGRDFTKAVARAMGIKREEASKLKNNPSPEKSEELLRTVQEVIGDLAREIQVSFSYYENEFGRKVERIFLSGGTSRMPGLSSSLSGRLEIEVNCWDPLKSLVISPDVNGEDMVKWKELLPVVIGLARRG